MTKDETKASITDIHTPEIEIQIMQEQNKRLSTIGRIVFFICGAVGFIMFFAVVSENTNSIIGGTIASVCLALMGLVIGRVMFTKPANQ